MHQVLTAVLCVLVAAGCDDDLELNSAWTAGAIAVDGSGEDWAEIQLEHLEEADVSFGVANDQHNLYLLIVTWNFPLIRMLQQEGITLWFDTTSGKKKDFGLNLIGGLTLSHPDHPERPMPANALEMAVYLQDEPFVISIDGKYGPIAAADCKGGVCAYEIRLPLARAANARYAVGVRPGETVAIGAELIVPRHRKKDKRKSMGRRAGKGMGGMGKMGGRGGMGGRSGMGGRGGMPMADQGQMGQKRPKPDHAAGPRPPQMEQKEVWFSVTLADAP